MNKCNFCVIIMMGHEKVEDFVFSPLVARVNNCDISLKKCHFGQSAQENGLLSSRTGTYRKTESSHINLRT